MEKLRDYEIYNKFFNENFEKSYFAHAKVTTLIRMPSIAERASAQATSVAPVVSTSSTSRTCFPDKDAASGVARNRFSTFTQRA